MFASSLNLISSRFMSQKKLNSSLRQKREKKISVSDNSQFETKMSDQQQIQAALNQLGEIDKSIMQRWKCQTMAILSID